MKDSPSELPERAGSEGGMGRGNEGVDEQPGWMEAWGQESFLLSVSSGPGERHGTSIMWETGTPTLLSLDPCVAGHQGDSCTVELRNYFADSPLPCPPRWEGQHAGARSA